MPDPLESSIPGGRADQGAALTGSPFQDRRHAGRELANHLAEYANRDDVVILGLPRGGVPVAAEVAVGAGYVDFDQTSDDEVRQALSGQEPA